MKKIRSSTQLELEQIRLKLHEQELEKIIRKDWKGLKQHLEPDHLGKEILKKISQKFRSFSA